MNYQQYTSHWNNVQERANQLREKIHNLSLKPLLSPYRLIGEGTLGGGTTLSLSTPCEASCEPGVVLPRDIGRLAVGRRVRAWLLDCGCSLSSLSYRLEPIKEGEIPSGINLPLY